METVGEISTKMKKLNTAVIVNCLIIKIVHLWNVLNVKNMFNEIKGLNYGRKFRGFI